uniref:Uncharacterized protein n=1 Tax=Panagrellus redivivus TaxID=6233 RepID=A0A7E4UNI8_PANRE
MDGWRTAHDAATDRNTDKSSCRKGAAGRRGDKMMLPGPAECHQSHPPVGRRRDLPCPEGSASLARGVLKRHLAPGGCRRRSLAPAMGHPNKQAVEEATKEQNRTIKEKKRRRQKKRKSSQVNCIAIAGAPFFSVGRCLSCAFQCVSLEGSQFARAFLLLAELTAECGACVSPSCFLSGGFGVEWEPRAHMHLDTSD